MKVKCIDEKSSLFPSNLKMLSKCPKQIFVIGDEYILQEFSLAVIGSRKCSVLGKSIAKDITTELSLNGIIIVSGLARGIDTIAHNACIENKAKTIAVLGGGHKKIYPKENLNIVDKILENGGAVISEYPLEYPPLPKNFRERNRIIAALSEGTVLIEAKNNSGSLITIEYARKLNKKIFVVPGCVDNELYEGSNFVLSEGAFCIRNAKDLIKKYPNIIYEEKNNYSEKINVEKELRNVYLAMSYTPKNLEEICLKSGEETKKVISKLALLEIKGLIKRIDGQNFIKIRQRNI